jgi:hypothetical protein
MREIRGPQSYGTILMAEMYDRVVLVLGHGNTCSELRAMFGDKLAC